MHIYSPGDDDQEEKLDSDVNTPSTRTRDIHHEHVAASAERIFPLLNNDDYSRMIAICDVPPEQIPEGVLNFARNYRSLMTHIRVVVAEEKEQGYDDTGNVNDGGGEKDRDSGRWNGNTLKKYLILVSLQSSKAAKSFVRNLNGKPFNNFESDVIASVFHVSRLELRADELKMEVKANLMERKSASTAKPSTPPFPLQHASLERRQSNEVNNCPVCLESMEFGRGGSDIDANTTSATISSVNVSNGTGPLFTTVCNHTFHMDCLLRCEDAPCPVCRYDHTGLNDIQVQCQKCGSTTGVMVCLICGVASCSNHISSISNLGNDGRGKYGLRQTTASGHNPPGVYSDTENSVSCSDRHGDMTLSSFEGHHGGCAKDHYDETLHAYALDTETQHVWDFAGQGYVHRLIQNEDDGKLVEIPDPTNTISGERSLIPSLTDAEENEVVHRKLEGYANEYHHLLQDQLEQQRRYFHGILQDIRRDHEESMKKSTPSDLISALKQELNQLQQRHQTLQKKYRKISDKRDFMKDMNESLEANKEPMRKEISRLQKQRKDYQSMLERSVPQLDKRVRQLMMRLEGDE